MDNTHPLGSSWRPITHGDVAAWRRLMDLVEDVDQTGERYDEADLHEEMNDPATGDDDRVAAWLGDEMVAYAGVRTRADATSYRRIDAEGGVTPRLRGHGLGARGVEWVKQRGADIHRQRDQGLESRVHILAAVANQPQVELLAAEDFVAVNWSAGMRVVLGDIDTSTAPVWPAALSLHRYAERWSTPMREAHNEAFVDHWGFVAWGPAEWEQWVGGSKNFRPHLSWVVVDEARPERVVGYVQSNEYEAFEAATGRREAYVAKIGVRREYRGRGLASALLGHCLREYAADGYAESALNVDTNNANEAYGLYKRAGFGVELSTAVFELVLPAASGAS